MSRANDLTDADLARGRELLAAGTPGVWGKVVGDTPEIGAYVMGTGVGYQVITNTDREDGDPVMDEADADLIVWMHDAVPRLLALVAAQAEQIAELTASNDRMAKIVDTNRHMRKRAEAAIDRVWALCDEAERLGGGSASDYDKGAQRLAQKVLVVLDGAE